MRCDNEICGIAWRERTVGADRGTAFPKVIHGTCGFTVHKPVDSRCDMRITRHILWMEMWTAKKPK